MKLNSYLPSKPITATSISVYAADAKLAYLELFHLFQASSFKPRLT